MESDENDLDNLFEEHDTEGRAIPEEAVNNNEGDTNNVNDTQTAERVPAPKRVVKNPRLKFNPDRLCGERGIPILINHFKGVKFKGKGYEVDDLNKLMSSLEHWCHRLFPSMTFSDCLRQIEKLGKKRPVQTCLRKIRLDMPILHSDFVRDDEDENPDNIQEELDVEIPPQDAFDRLLNEVGDNNYAQLASTPLPAKRQEIGQSLGTSFGSTLTEEQKKRMEYNKLLATERRKAKLQAMQSGGSSSQDSEIFPSIQVPSTHIDSEEIRIRDQNSLSVNPNMETLNEASTENAPLSSICHHSPQSPSVLNSNAEELGLDDLIDLVDEDDKLQVTEKNGRKMSSSIENSDRQIEVVDLEKDNTRIVNTITHQPIEVVDLDNLVSNKQIDVIDLANRRVKNSSNIEVVDLEKDNARIVNSITHQTREVIDLENLISNEQTDVIDLDNSKSKNSLINIDSEEEPAAKRFRKGEINLQIQEDIPCDDLNKEGNSDILEMDTHDIHTENGRNTINNLNINPIQSEDVID